MLDWNNYREELVVGVGDLAKHSPETVRGYGTLSNAGAKTNHLDARTRELIALSAAISLRCDGCIAIHTAEAQKLGLSKDEISEALGVAISINTGAALTYSVRALNAFDAAERG